MTKKYNYLLLASLFVITCLLIVQNNIAAKEETSLHKKDILKALFKNQDVLLKKSSHCNGVGTEESDLTIGDYLSGFWAFHGNKNGKNWIEVEIIKSSNSIYLAKVLLYRKDQEENWGWGVSFKLDNKTRVQRDSFTCIGSG